MRQEGLTSGQSGTSDCNDVPTLHVLSDLPLGLPVDQCESCDRPTCECLLATYWSRLRAIGSPMRDREAIRRHPSGLKPISRPKYPPHDREADQHEQQRRAEAHADADIGDAVEAPAKAVDEIHNGIE